MIHRFKLIQRLSQTIVLIIGRIQLAISDHVVVQIDCVQVYRNAVRHLHWISSHQMECLVFALNHAKIFPIVLVHVSGVSLLRTVVDFANVLRIPVVERNVLEVKFVKHFQLHVHSIQDDHHVPYCLYV